jgi:hypothetical protein
VASEKGEFLHRPDYEGKDEFNKQKPQKECFLTPVYWENMTMKIAGIKNKDQRTFG